MSESSDRASRTWMRYSCWRVARPRSSIICLAVLLVLSSSASHLLLADGCFVFKWDKKTDINEPTQKAIIVYDAGREDLLLQVKYEGPLEEFGWLIPVPSLPKVEKGSMEPFYELSPLTQGRFGGTKGVATMGLDSASGRGAAVKVIEIKTVGAYEVAVLSTQDARSLDRWLKANDYSIPGEKSGVIDEYIRKGWYFVAAKIDLKKAVAFKAVSGAGSKDSTALAKARKVVQTQLASGELHPLLISFDSPACVFPLKISAVGGKPSEISIYVLSKEPLLNKFIFDDACEKLDQRHAEWEQTKPQREKSLQTSLQNQRTMMLAWQMYSFNSTNGFSARPARKRDWSVEDLAATSREGQPPLPPRSLDDDFYASLAEILQCLLVKPDQIKETVKNLPRLKNRSWYLTKQVRIFAPAEMHDLEFQPAIPALVGTLASSAGRVAAQVLSQLGSDAVSVLITASKSRNSVKRINAVTAFENFQDRRLVEPLLDLLKDEAPQVRFHALRAVGNNWEGRFGNPLVALLRDPNQEIRSEAAGCLAWHEGRDRTDVYLTLLQDPETDVRLHALGVLSRLNSDVIPLEPLVEMLKNPDQDVQSAALHIIWKLDRDIVPRADLTPLLGSSRTDIVNLVLALIERTGRVHLELPEPLASAREQEQRPNWISSSEAATLVTNQLATVRIIGLRVLGRNADAQAVELALPLLRDTNAIVRSSAFYIFQNLSGQNISENDPAKWEQWWITNKTAFSQRR